MLRLSVARFHLYNPLLDWRTVSSGVGYVSSFFLLPTVSVGLETLRVSLCLRLLPPSYPSLYSPTIPRCDALGGALSKKYQFVELLRSKGSLSSVPDFYARDNRFVRLFS